MNPVGRFVLLLAGLVRWPLRVWLRSRMTPSDLDELELDPDKPVCYVLANGGLTDWLTLEAACAVNGLARPAFAGHRLPGTDRPAVMALPRGPAMPGSALHRMVAHGLQDHGSEVQLVPVSIFWGRNPVRETSLLRILFADSQHPGRMRKLLIVLAQGRNVLVHLGRPLDTRTLAMDAAHADSAMRKLVRVLRLHFQRQRSATLGPPLSHRFQVINSVLADTGVRQAVDQVAHTQGISLQAARARARGLADEIAADYSNIAIGFMLRVLEWLWNRIYDGVDVRHLERLRETARNASLVYLPAHRSHMDYLLVSYILYREGIALPQIAAGINLNFRPVGGLLRRCGAFYLRRSFRGDTLYTAVFRAYIDVLIGRGTPLKFYLEGGRSRTGRLLPPKTGLLSMVARGFLRHGQRPIALVPVYIGYDRVMEVRSYLDELGGGNEKESVTNLVRSSGKVLRRNYGRAYIAFGQPLSLAEFADAHHPDWRQWQTEGQDHLPPWLEAFTETLAHTAMVRINAAATLNAAGLVSLVLLGSRRNAVAADEMVHTLELLVRLARAAPYSRDVTLPAADGHALLAQAEPLTRIRRVPHQWGDVLAVDPRQAVLLTYARNSVMHLFALPSLLANALLNHDRRHRSAIVADGVTLYPLLASELFLRWHSDEVTQALETNLDGMLECGLVESHGDGMVGRPAMGTDAFSALMALARIMHESLERYGMTVALLARNLEAGAVEPAAFERQCQLMAERIAILSGRNSPEFFDLRLFRNHLATLQQAGLLEARGESLHIQPGIAHLAEHTLQLLNPHMRQSILHITSRPPPDTGTETHSGPVAEQ